MGDENRVARSNAAAKCIRSATSSLARLDPELMEGIGRHGERCHWSPVRRQCVDSSRSVGTHPSEVFGLKSSYRNRLKKLVLKELS